MHPLRYLLDACERYARAANRSHRSRVSENGTLMDGPRRAKELLGDSGGGGPAVWKGSELVAKSDKSSWCNRLAAVQKRRALIKASKSTTAQRSIRDCNRKVWLGRGVYCNKG